MSVNRVRAAAVFESGTDRTMQPNFSRLGLLSLDGGPVAPPVLLSPSPHSFRAALNQHKATHGPHSLLDLPVTPAFSHVRKGLQVDNSLVADGGLGLFTRDEIEAGGFVGVFSGVLPPPLPLPHPPLRPVTQTRRLKIGLGLGE